MYRKFLVLQEKICDSFGVSILIFGSVWYKKRDGLNRIFCSDFCGVYRYAGEGRGGWAFVSFLALEFLPEIIILILSMKMKQVRQLVVVLNIYKGGKVPLWILSGCLVFKARFCQGRFILYNRRKMTNTTKKSNSKELATINFQTSNFSFELWEFEWEQTLDVYYKSTSLSTGISSNKLKSYWILDLDKAKFGMSQLQKLYSKFWESQGVWTWLKEMISNDIITEPLGK